MSRWDDFVLAADNAGVLLQSMTVTCQGERCERTVDLERCEPSSIERMMNQMVLKGWDDERCLCEDCSDAFKVAHAAPDFDEMAKERRIA